MSIQQVNRKIEAIASDTGLDVTPTEQRTDRQNKKQKTVNALLRKGIMDWCCTDILAEFVCSRNQETKLFAFFVHRAIIELCRAKRQINNPSSPTATLISHHLPLTWATRQQQHPLPTFKSSYVLFQMLSNGLVLATMLRLHHVIVNAIFRKLNLHLFTLIHSPCVGCILSFCQAKGALSHGTFISSSTIFSRRTGAV
jgi:hypothetical protein